MFHKKNKSLSACIDQLAQQMADLQQSLKKIEQLLEKPHQSSPLSSEATPKNDIYQKHSSIDFTTQPLYEYLAQSKALVDILEQHQMKVTDIQTNVFFSRPEETPRAIDLLLACTHEQNPKQQFIIAMQCYHSVKQLKENLEQWETTENLNQLDQYLLTTFPEHHIAYGIGYKTEEGMPQPTLPDYYFVLAHHPDGSIQLGQKTNAFQQAKSHSPQLTLSDYIPEKIYKGVHIDILETLIKRKHYRHIATHTHIIVKKKNTLMYFDVLLHSENNFTERNYLFIIRIVPILRLLSIYEMQKDVSTYRNALKKLTQNTKKKMRYTKYNFVPLILYRKVGQPYILETAEEQSVLTLSYDLTNESIEDPGINKDRFFS